MDQEEEGLTSAEEVEEDSALDGNLSDKSDWPHHLDIEVKEAAKKISSLALWLKSSGFILESERVSLMLREQD